MAACTGKRQCSTKAFVSTVCEIKHHDVVSYRILVHKFSDQRPREWTQQAITTLVDATEAYMVDVIAESHM